MTNSISFLHAADLHLDSPFKGLTHIPDTIFQQIRNSTFDALDNLVSTAIHKKVDFVLLVGDLFDHENQSLRAQVHLKKAFEQLEAHQINVYLSYGNHDYIHGNVHPITYPKNVFIFPNETITSFIFEKNNEPLASIYGFSYENRSLTTNKATEFTIQNETIPFHIGMLHGTVHGNKDHDPYAPFQLSQLREKMFDYWALGHIHTHEQLSDNPPIVYPGNIQGRHRNESGEKGCYHVQLSTTDSTLEFIPLQSILFENITVDVSTCNSIYEIEGKILKSLFPNHAKTLYHLTFYSNTDEIISFEENGTLEELIEVINESLINEREWSYIYTYRMMLEELPIFHQDDIFIGEIIQSLEELSVSQAVKDLYHHPIGRKFLTPISEAEIKEQAKQLLIHELLHVEEGE